MHGFFLDRYTTSLKFDSILQSEIDELNIRLGYSRHFRWLSMILVAVGIMPLDRARIQALRA